MSLSKERERERRVFLPPREALTLSLLLSGGRARGGCFVLVRYVGACNMIL